MGSLTLADKQTLELLRDQLPGLVDRIIEALAVEVGDVDVHVPRRPIAWGQRVSETFRERVWWIADKLVLDPDDLMTCMAWESGRTFSPAKRNLAGSGATGLIQFMPKTALALGTTTEKLAAMTAEDQLNFVYKYLKPWGGRVRGLSDLYMTILWPKAVGKPDDYVMWDKAKMPTTFRQNAGLDINRDGKVTKAECAAKLHAMKAEGLRLAA